MSHTYINYIVWHNILNVIKENQQQEKQPGLKLNFLETLKESEEGMMFETTMNIASNTTTTLPSSG